MKRVLLLLLAAAPIWAQFGNATRLQTVPICPGLTTTNSYILTYSTSSGCLTLAANGGASGSLTGTLTSGVVPKATGTTTLGDSGITDDGTTISATENFSIKAKPFIIELPNSSTGTTNGLLAKMVNTAGTLQAQTITTSAADQTSALGCVISGGGTTGTALIMVAGTGSCKFDGAVTAGHIAVPSSTSAGTLHDTGSASTPATGEIMATIGATNACASPPCTISGNLFGTPDIVNTGGNGNGGGNGGNGGSKQQLYTYQCVMGSATGTTVLTTGDTGCYATAGPRTGTINRIDIVGNGASLATCSITVDIWKANAAYPTSSDKISASAPLTLSSAKTAFNGARTSWVNTTVAATDVFGSSIASVTGCVYAVATVYFQ